MYALLNSIRGSIRNDQAMGGKRHRIVLLSTAVPLVAVAALSVVMTAGDQSSEVKAEPVKLVTAAPEAAIAVQRETKAARPAEPEPEAEAAGDTELRLSPLDRADPRWAAAEPAVPDASRGPVADALRQHAENVDEGEGATPPLDRSTTAAIASDPSAGADVETEPAGTDTSVAVAETPAEVAALEAAAADAASAKSDPAFSASSTTMLDAHAKEWVNFRDAPSDDSNVIRVVAYDEAFKAQPVEECVHFCAVVVDGKPGYIHKSFISYADGQPTGAVEPAEAASATLPAAASSAPATAEPAATVPADAEPAATAAR
jgi:hypothetical protein